MTDPGPPPAAPPTGDAAAITASLEEPERFAALFDRHYDRIAGYLRRRLDRSVAEDLAAQTFLVAFGARAGYDAARPDAAPWLYGIATNLLRRHHRAEARRWQAYAREAGSEGRAGGGASVEEQAIGGVSPAIAAALGELRGADRDALLLLAWGELDYAEIAGALSVPIGTVRSRIHRARTALAGALDAPRSAAPEPDSPSLHPVGTAAGKESA